jgi:cysteine synthase A
MAGYASLGEEIWRQTEGKIDAFVQSVGTSASLNGVATVLKRYNPKVKIVAVEPDESSVLRGNQPGAHDIEGIGVGYTPPLWNPTLVDEVLSVKTEDAKDMARQLARRDGIFAGTSSGGNVHAAIRVAKKLGPSSRVVTLMIDSGLKYVSTDLYRQR